MSARTGYAAILTASALFGAAATIGSVLLRLTSPFAALVVANSLGALSLVPFTLRIRPRREDLPVLIAWSANGAALAPVLYFYGLYGLQGTTPTEAALLSNLEALFTVAVAFAFLRERVPRTGYVGIVALLLGAVAVTTNLDFVHLRFTAHLAGNTLVILSALCWGIDNNVSRRLVTRYDPKALAGLKLAIGLAFLWPAAFLLGTSFALPLEALGLAAVFGIATLSVVMLLMYVSVREIGAMRAGALISTSALFGVAVAFVVLRQPPTPVQLGGGLLMVAGTFLIAGVRWRRRKG